jgi:hypothetical protein
MARKDPDQRRAAIEAAKKVRNSQLSELRAEHDDVELHRDATRAGLSPADEVAAVAIADARAIADRWWNGPQGERFLREASGVVDRPTPDGPFIVTQAGRLHVEWTPEAAIALFLDAFESTVTAALKARAYRAGLPLAERVVQCNALEKRRQALEAEHTQACEEFIEAGIPAAFLPHVAQRRQAEAIARERASAEHRRHDLANRKAIARVQAEVEDRAVAQARARVVAEAGPNSVVVDEVRDGRVIAFNVTTGAGDRYRVIRDREEG